MDDTVAVVLAAGKGTRMYSDLAKVLHPICGRPMLSYTLAALQELGLNRMLVVVGHQAERVKEIHAELPVEWVLQEEQLGTAHAVQCALPHLADFVGSVLICCGDTPLLTADTLQMFMSEHVNTHADLSILSMLLESPGNYGRILRDSRGAVLGIIEAKDASDRERDIREVNTGIYCVRADVLRVVIPDIENANVQGEYYLTDLVQTAVQRDWMVQAVTAADPEEFLGVNTQEELAAAETTITRRIQR
jgi:bifunctional UDP-N-acetylglucosamine pyrophosphorylase/glucosamine-1-phosphate N-acetyltransferase